jgi:glutathione synthase/RimK-type ligase-like ATP-grasp enzyme
VSKPIFVVESLTDWKLINSSVQLVHVDDYLTGAEYHKERRLQVVNLCRSYRYLSIGYYCSLLGEARGHKMVPSVKTMLDLSRKSIYSLDTDDLDDQIQRAFKHHPQDETNRFELAVFFGYCRHATLATLARHIFEVFPVPLLMVNFERDEGAWRIESLRPPHLRQLDEGCRSFFAEALQRYLGKPPRTPRKELPVRYDLAILVDPKDPLPPSDKVALKKFIRAGRKIGIEAELIEKKDYPRLAEYDALFIRDTTRINHYTYRFARKAESEGMVVIDDPRSILLCTNKVYLAELLRANRIPTPKTVIVGKRDLKAVERAIGFPMVLKVPDGSFSQGVFKVENSDRLREVTAKLFEDSELILAQEFLPTEYDWRIGIINRQPIYVAQYFMSKEHWQIVKYDDKGGFTQGRWKTWAVGDAPAEVVETALKAANLIGDGLYGVDMKQNANGVYVIEVNDNPNLDDGVENEIIKDRLYDIIMADFLRRLEKRHGRTAPPTTPVPPV